MTEMPERRGHVRLSVPGYLTGLFQEIRLVRLLDLSLEGACIEHPEPVREGAECFVDLPRALARLRLMGQVVWTRPRHAEPTTEGEVIYQSGLTFQGIEPEQRTALTAALELLSMEGQRPSQPEGGRT